MIKTRKINKKQKQRKRTREEKEINFSQKIIDNITTNLFLSVITSSANELNFLIKVTNYTTYTIYKRLTLDLSSYTG